MMRARSLIRVFYMLYSLWAAGVHWLAIRVSER